MRIAAAFALLAILNAGALLAQSTPTTAPSAAVMYEIAASSIDTPANPWSGPELSPYPPDSLAWRMAAQEEWKEGEFVRNTARKARAISDTPWPDDTSYFNSCKRLAADLNDAALYLDFQGKHAQAVEQALDILHMADLLQEKRPSDKLVERMLYGALVRGIAANCLEEIISGTPLTSDPGNDRDLKFSAAHNLIAQLLATRKAVDIMTDTYGGPPESVAWISHGKALNQKIMTSLGTIRTECLFAAISLACHVYDAKKGRWPDNLNDLVPDDLPQVPLDPWSDDTKPFGYVLFPGWLPTGSDRPLIYCRCNSKDGLFYRIDKPQFRFYESDGATSSVAPQKQGGQFRDIVRWQPMGKITGPTTRPLP